jgi:hypothetical protein
MSKPVINFIFSIGVRCYAVNFLDKYNLRKMSSPFDYMHVDFESCLKIINNNFEDFLSDIVLFNKNEKKIKLHYAKNTTEVNKKFYELLENNIGYMADSYNNNNLLFNQNYIDETSMNSNLYSWNNICSFIHHNILEKDIYNIKKNRYERFNKIMNKYYERTALFHITKIINANNIMSYMKHIVVLKKKYNIKCFLIVIINCGTISRSYHTINVEDKCLFLVKPTESYMVQYLKNKIDNKLENYSYYNEYKIMLNYFTFNIIEKKVIDNT